jgi:prepilin peptidase CpaA
MKHNNMWFQHFSSEVGIAAVILGFAAYIDWKEHRVPNWLTFVGWGLGIIFHSVGSGSEGFKFSLVGSAVGLGTLILPYALGGMGAGDVKLMAAVGAWLGPAITWYGFIWSAFAGAIMGAYTVLTSGEARARLQTMWLAAKNLFRLQKLDAGSASDAPVKILLPYGVPIAVGFYAYFIFGRLF